MIPKPPVQPTEAYKAWERLKLKRMWAGLMCLSGGFVLQMAALWMNP